ncbi:MAG TPA: Fe-S cluster domain-containing protein [Clostridiales bacterium]|nr:Fe-S cluster domain-containing protein [Clostridiales bacterium]
MIESILYPILILSGMGLLFGVGLALAYKKYEVKVDPKVENVREVLPGANCGACGYPGCDGFASAVVSGEASPSGCPVGGVRVTEAISEILGVEVDIGEELIAKVLCQGGKDKAKDKFIYVGVEDCVAASMLSNGPKSCSYGCLGLGSCVEACQFDAIHINERGIAQVDEDRCTACGKCIDACPKGLIEMVPKKSLVHVICMSKDRGKDVRQYCDIGCIACQICVKACKFDAIEIKNNVAKIDYSKCTNCMVCAEKCPTNAIYANFERRKIAHIDAKKCIGCTICSQNCSFDAIEGERKVKHMVVDEKCTGCGICASKCPTDAITMRDR